MEAEGYADRYIRFEDYFCLVIVSRFCRKTMFLKRKVKPHDFEIKVMPRTRRVRVCVIGAIDGQVLTEHQTSWLNVREGKVIPIVGKGILTVGVYDTIK